MGDTTYRAYPYRWAVLVTFMLVNFMIQALWIDFSPVATAAASYYGVSKDAIDLLGELFMIIYLPMSIPVSWSIDRFGFRKATGLGAILMALFALVRAFAGPSFALALIGTIGLSIAQPFLMNAWTKVAAHWFAVTERATAVGLVTLSTLLGIAVGIHVSGSLAKTMQIGAIQYVYAAAAVVASLAYLVVARENPPTPSGPLGSGEKALMLQGLKDALAVPSFRLFLIVAFIGMGLFNGLMILIDQIIGPKGFDPVQIANLGDLLLIGGLFGSVAIPALSDRTRKRKVWMIVGLAGSLPGLVGMTFAHGFLLIAISSFVLGFFLTSLMPVGMQFATEVTLPTPEGTTNGLVQLCGQFSVVFVLMMQALKGPSGSFTLSLMASGLFVVAAAVLVPFMKEARRPIAQAENA
jgi:sugar phosphate permease